MIGYLLCQSKLSDTRILNASRWGALWKEYSADEDCYRWLDNITEWSGLSRDDVNLIQDRDAWMSFVFGLNGSWPWDIRASIPQRQWCKLPLPFHFLPVPSLSPFPLPVISLPSLPFPPLPPLPGDLGAELPAAGVRGFHRRKKIEIEIGFGAFWRIIVSKRQLSSVSLFVNKNWHNDVGVQEQNKD